MTKWVFLTVILLPLIPDPGLADDWPMFGRDATRNAVSPEKDPPVSWQLKDVAIKWDKDGQITERATRSQNIKWTAQLGTMCLSAPVVADGLVWIGTNQVNREADGKRREGAVLRCYREADGRLLYEYISPNLTDNGGKWPDRYHDSSFWQGLACSPLVEGDRLWFVSNRSEVICLDISSLRQHREASAELPLVWKIDLPRQLGVYPRVMFMGPGRLCSIGAAYKDRIYVATSNGSDYVKRTVPAPQAPSLVCIDKHNGEVRWKDSTPGANLLQGSFGSPLVAEINGRGQVIAPQGDGWLRAFDAISGQLIWEFDINPKTAEYDHAFGRGGRNWFMSTPVLYGGRIYMASGQGAEQGEGPGRLCCIDPTKKGDISSELAVDAQGKTLPKRRELAADTKKGEKAVPNPNSGLVWEFAKVGDEFEDEMHRTVCTVAIHDGLVIAPDTAGALHCLDASTGIRYWSHDGFAEYWASPLIVDRKVFVGDTDGVIRIFELSKVKHDPVEINIGNGVYASPVYASGVLYVPRKDMLVAIKQEPVK